MVIHVQYHIRELRVKRNLSLRQLEYASGISRTHISDIENGKHDVTVKTLCMLAEALKVSPGDLFSYEIMGNRKKASDISDKKLYR